MKKVLLVILVVAIAICTCGCFRQADRVAYNISREADSFNVTRRLAVVNARTDKPIFELVGNFAISNTSSRELQITVEVGPGQYKKHYVYLNDWTLYVVEDVSGSNVSRYHYEVNFLPEMFIPYTFTMND